MSVDRAGRRGVRRCALIAVFIVSGLGRLAAAQPTATPTSTPPALQAMGPAPLTPIGPDGVTPAIVTPFGPLLPTDTPGVDLPTDTPGLGPLVTPPDEMPTPSIAPGGPESTPTAGGDPGATAVAANTDTPGVGPDATAPPDGSPTVDAGSTAPPNTPT